MTDYEAVWQVLADHVRELRKAGEVVPSHVMKDLRSARTTIEIMKSDKDNPVHFLRIEEFLGSVESYIICVSQKRFGVQTMSSWMKRLDQARRKIPEETQPSSRFVPGLPRDKHWIRIKPGNDIPLERIKLMAEEEGLEHKPHNSGYIIVYGEKSRLENLIRRVAELHKS